ncbi:NADH:flavin oxidoreductase/NADH oxidase [Streptomyces sp. SL13]|uniref:NADH:flavin oxidoreductase/NADH oxidase n=1 Tax=Streptantibioticus silvisoli TaxID=2705255 RepID=A0AA90KFX6_9ACTN|nr:NADH:flavin oxidoreductase/NADH oxidase [Streptantibioticus silvisoli]MDI5969825.1 NADH:flavin oxidoreductase/NADH oxidase [Streptantibioticus silvisoli]
MSQLFEPYRLRSLTIPNRVWMPPMNQYSATSQGPDVGVPTDWHVAHQGARAAGGAGLILTEGTGVSPTGRTTPYDLGIWSDAQLPGFRRITGLLTSLGAVPGIQLSHSGSKGSTDRQWLGRRRLGPEQGGWRPVGPDELALADIDRIVDEFAAAARRAAAAGYQVVELLAGHGYLIHQFLSPVSNHRTDSYGGSFGNRTRFALRVVDAVRAVWPDGLPLFVRVSATDWLTENPSDGREGWTVDDTVRLANALAGRGVDLLDVSSGGIVPDAKIPVGPGYQVPLAARVKAESGVPVAAVGMITEPDQAAKILANSEADAILIGRELLRHPSWPIDAAGTLGAEPRIPLPYRRAY